MVSTRALENRGPEEFTLRTASGGENNPKVKKGRVGARARSFHTCKAPCLLVLPNPVHDVLAKSRDRGKRDGAHAVLVAGGRISAGVKQHFYAHATP